MQCRWGAFGESIGSSDKRLNVTDQVFKGATRPIPLEHLKLEVMPGTALHVPQAGSQLEDGSTALRQQLYARPPGWS